MKESKDSKASENMHRAFEGACITQIYLGGYSGGKKVRQGQSNDHNRGVMESLTASSDVTLVHEVEASSDGQTITYLKADDEAGLPYKVESRIHKMTGTYTLSEEEVAAQQRERDQVTMKASDFKKFKAGTLCREGEAPEAASLCL